MRYVEFTDQRPEQEPADPPIEALTVLRAAHGSEALCKKDSVNYKVHGTKNKADSISGMLLGKSSYAKATIG